jgi:protease I
MARIAFILDDAFEDSELRIPYDRLRKAGHEVVVIGGGAEQKLKGKRGKETIRTDAGIDEVSPAAFDALVIPGGYSPDKLRADERMVEFTRAFARAGKLVAAVCHGPSMLAEADLLEGRTVTSWPSIKTDLVNAGAQWVDRPVVIDGTIITARKPEDLRAFSDAILRHLEGQVAERPEGPSLH